MTFGGGKIAGVTVGGVTAVLLASLFQLVLKDLLFTTMGVGRHMQSIQEFSYDCRRIHHNLLESCEDLWFDDEGRKLYAACSEPAGRGQWNPSASRYNTSARGLNDRVAVLSVDERGPSGIYGLQELQIVGEYRGPDSGFEIDLHGFDVEILKDGRLRFFMINHRPPIDFATGAKLDPKKVGANSTVEVFELRRGSTEWNYIKTIVDEAIATPNKVAATGDGGFMVTNDHRQKVGLIREFEMIIGGGSIAYCSADDKCHIAANGGFNYPNGMVKGKDNLYYVPSSITGRISVHSLNPDLTLTKIDDIKLGMPIDNLSVDGEGDIFAAAFPKALQLMAALDAPLTTKVPSTIWRIRKLCSTKPSAKPKWEVTKMLEDGEGAVLPGTTTARHDAKTGNFWLGGPTADFITVCEKRF